ncbi:MAG: hypothetical protein ACYC21_03245 [Eubacteriales bacterium]
MTNLKKVFIALGLVVGILVVYVVMGLFSGDLRNYPKVFYEYKQKGKSTQFNTEDVRKGFN